MISLSKKTKFLQIVIDVEGPRADVIGDVECDLLWVNALDNQVYEFVHSTHTFTGTTINLFNDVIYLDYEKFVIITGKDFIIRQLRKLEKLDKFTGLTHLVTNAANKFAILENVPSNITVVSSPDRLLLLLFLLLIKYPPTTVSQLTANLINSANAFDNLVECNLYE